MWQKVVRCVARFNETYDFLARVVKLCVLLLLIGLVWWRWSYVDLRRTGTELVKKNTPFQFQEPETGAPPVGPPSASMPTGPPSVHPQPQPQPRPAEIDYLNIYQFGQLIFTADKPYEIRRDTIVFDKLLQKGRPDYDKTFVYAGVEIRIARITEYIGLLISGGSVEGPVLRGVHCIVVRR